GFVPSMSRKGNCWDNAVAESFFATLKNEEATGVYETRAAAHAAIASYIHGFYNPTRLHSALGYLSPNDYAKTLKQAT
ncbi:integrase core domain-containing protein, partial [Xanthomonas campestris pv. phormiicola]|nr:integrase core domain-containing protein [Xanthomonas campestris pv. phormiicola]